MKRTVLLTILCAVAMTLAAVGQGHALTLDFSNVTNATITFVGTGNTFSFPNGDGGFDFQITGSDGSDPDTVTLRGNIGGTFTIGAISSPFTGFQQATATSSTGKLKITDEGSTELSADLVWVDIFTFYGSGGLNAGGSFNLSNISYSGANTDLLFLKNGANQSATLSFSFTPAKSLTQLTTDGATNSTSYAGNMSAVPVPASVLLLGSGLLGLGLLGFRRQSS